MADEIKIDCDFWPNPYTDANAFYDVVDQSNDKFNPSGITLPDTLASRINFSTQEPIPDDINGTPAAELWIYWSTQSSDTSSNVEFGYGISDVTEESTTRDPTTWDDSGDKTDTSSGATKLNVTKITITTSTVTAGKFLEGFIDRDAQGSNPSDALASNVLIEKIMLVADQA